MSRDAVETAVNVSNTGGKRIMRITYHDDTDAGDKIAYTSSRRKVAAGATLLV